MHASIGRAARPPSPARRRPSVPSWHCLGTYRSELYSLFVDERAPRHGTLSPLLPLASPSLGGGILAMQLAARAATGHKSIHCNWIGQWPQFNETAHPALTGDTKKRVEPGATPPSVSERLTLHREPQRRAVASCLAPRWSGVVVLLLLASVHVHA